MHEQTHFETAFESSTQEGVLQPPVLDSATRNRTVETICLIADRLRDPTKTLEIAEIARSQVQMTFHWSTPSLTCGFGSLALLYSYLARSFPGQGWEHLANRYVQMAAQGTHDMPFTQPGVFHGSSGLAMVILLLSRIDPRYQKASKKLAEEVATQVLERQWEKTDAGVSPTDYDIIGGAAGILSYLISTGSGEVVVQDAISLLLDYLIWLSSYENQQERKRWFIPPEKFLRKQLQAEYPEGYFDAGLAHGIPGPLAALCLAWQAGYRVEGQREAIETMANWIVSWQVQDTWGINWPMGVPLHPSVKNQYHIYPTRAAWCYGAPGVSRALWLASLVLEDKQLRRTSLEAIEAVLKRPIPARSIDSPTLCHGVAGLLTICLRFAHEVESPLIRQSIPGLVEQILSVCSPDLPLGVQDEEVRGNYVDDPGFLTGAAGVALALLAAISPVEADWDRILLVS